MGKLKQLVMAASLGAVIVTGGAAQAAADPLVDSSDALGPVGDTGSTGPVGPTITGSTGTTGSTGSSGTSGSTGSTGSNGSNGNNSGGSKPGNKGGNESETPGKSGITDVVPKTSAPLSIDTPDSNFSLGGDATPTVACDGTAGAPKNLVPIYLAAAKRYGLGPRGASILAAINKVETDFGRLNQVTSSAGAIGWMQFMPATWDMYATDGDGDGTADPYNASDAIHAAARYLQAAGAPDNWYDAIWAYNHADWYVEDVLAKAGCYGTFDPITIDTKRKEFTCEVSDGRRLEVPGNYLTAFENAASRYELGQKGVWSLAAVARLESDYGRGMTAKQLAATGPMGLTKEEWAKFAVDGDEDGVVNRDNVEDSVSTFARMMWAQGGVKPGLFAHNHAAWYVQATLLEADRIAGQCEVASDDWSIAFPDSGTANTINWDNLTVLNPAAQSDLQNGLIDARIEHLLAILTQKYTLEISALRSDHSMMTASGNVSNHYYGRAMDIAVVNGVSCTDMSSTSPCSEVGRLLTLLPDGVKPTELIYGYDLDGPGPAFALPDHRNHIHAGFGPA